MERGGAIPCRSQGEAKDGRQARVLHRLGGAPRRMDRNNSASRKTQRGSVGRPMVGKWVFRCSLVGLLSLVLTVGAEASDVPHGGTAQQRLTLDLHAVEIDRALEIIGRASGMNLVVGSNVRGRVTVYLKDVSWQEALDSILQVNGFGYVRQGNIIRIDKLDVLRKERELQLQGGC